MNKEKYEEIIRQYVDVLGVTYPCKMASDITSEQLSKAKSEYAYGLEEKGLIAMLDISPSQNGKHGYIFADGYMIFREKGGDNSFAIYRDIKSVELDKYDANRLYIKMEDEKVYRMCDEAINKEMCKEMILKLREEGKKEPKKEVKKRKIENHLSHEEKLELVKHSLCDIAGGYKFYAGDSMPYDLVKKVIKKFDPRIKPESILGFIDTSLLGNGKSGCLFTDDSIYWTEILSPVQRMRYDDLKTIAVMEKSTNDSDNYIIMLTHYDLKSHNIEYNDLKKTPLKNLLEKLQTIKYEIIDDEE